MSFVVCFTKKSSYTFVGVIIVVIQWCHYEIMEGKLITGLNINLIIQALTLIIIIIYYINEKTSQ